MRIMIVVLESYRKHTGMAVQLFYVFYTEHVLCIQVVCSMDSMVAGKFLTAVTMPEGHSTWHALPWSMKAGHVNSTPMPYVRAYGADKGTGGITFYSTKIFYKEVAKPVTCRPVGMQVIRKRWKRADEVSHSFQNRVSTTQLVELS